MFNLFKIMETAENENICRICLKKNKVIINLFVEIIEFENATLCSLLKSCTDISVDPKDIYPKFICKDCINELFITINFREKCKKSNEILSQFKPEEYENNNKNAEEIDLFNEFIIECNDVNTNDIKNEIEIFRKENENERNLEEIIEDSYEISFNFNRSLNEKSENTEEINISDEKENYFNKYIIFDENITSDEEQENQELPKNELILKRSNGKENNEKTFKIRKKNICKNSQKQQISNYTCDSCGANFNRLYNLRKHIQTHNFEEIYECAICYWPFSKYLNLENHCLSSHMDVLKENGNNDLIEKSLKEIYFCCVCEKSFPLKSSLKSHLRTHSNEHPFKCTKCEKTFLTKGNLTLHLKRHDGLKPYKCKYCGKDFNDNSNLNVHLRTHTGEKPHKCTICDKRFSRVFLLQLHQRIHTGEKPFSCTICNKSFRQKGDLLVHNRIHSERPYKCTLCSKSFIKHNLLKNHTKSHLKNSNKQSLVLSKTPTKSIPEIASTATENYESDIKNYLDTLNSIKDVEDNIVPITIFSTNEIDNIGINGNVCVVDDLDSLISKVNI